MSKVNYEFEIYRISVPVESITGVWEFHRPSNFKYLCYSLPGHLLHLVTKGSYTVRINSRVYEVNEGDVIYYYESEEVESIGNETEVTFYSVGFQASKLSPLSIENRVFQSTSGMQLSFKRLFEGYSSYEAKPRPYKTFAALMDILSGINELYRMSQDKDEENEELWWALERRIREQKMFRPSLSDLSEIAGYSRATVIRSCKKVTGLTPQSRMQIIRMEEAKGLLSFANLNVSQVAEYLGYPRMHEFSREFSRYFGKPPSKFLKK
ncbi:AraC family transcriptional regulator [Seonamhaeicola sp.]|uniref:AraC family transcriptional regulator n=1 Tax=Seonamhaeicola sp. TaxID=1912245 RepID=UPI0026268383|nr:AraC family transcriptional regulator [Seonamhaeicola sp.]